MSACRPPAAAFAPRRLFVFVFVLLWSACAEPEAPSRPPADVSSPDASSPDTTAPAAPPPAAPDGDVGAADRTVDPAVRVGAVTPRSSEADLIAVYGADQVEQVDVPVGEGMTVPGTRLLGGTPDALLIEWHGDRRRPRRITIETPGTAWRTPQGLTVGTPLREVVAANGGPFRLTGFGWDYPGRTLVWLGGALPSTLQLAFHPQGDVDAGAPMGEGPFRSDDAAMAGLDLRVEALYVRWE